MGLLLIAGVVFLTIALKSKKTHQYWDDWECSFVDRIFTSCRRERNAEVL